MREIDSLVVRVRHEIVVVEICAELERVLLVWREFCLEQAGNLILFREVDRLAVSILVVAGVALADAAQYGERVVETIGPDGGFRPSAVVRSVGDGCDAAIVLAIADKVVNIIGAEVGRAHERVAAAHT